MSVIGEVHGRYVHSRRVQILADHLAACFSADARVLDCGCGDGLIARLIMQRRPDVDVTGVDVLVRPHTHIPVDWFDGATLPYPDNSFDAVMFVDVLHHTDDPTILLKEARRVARAMVVLKDHTRDGLFAEATLRFMDDVGNAHHGVARTYNYWPKATWLQAFAALDLTIDSWNKDLRIYSAPANWVFGRSLHFVARLAVPVATTPS